MTRLDGGQAPSHAAGHPTTKMTAMATSPASCGTAGTTGTTGTVGKPRVELSDQQRDGLELKVMRHTRSSPIPADELDAFRALVNDSFRGKYHDDNFGDKLRYPTEQDLLDDLNHDDAGGWAFVLSTPDAIAVACAKVTFSGEGMDGAPGIHNAPDPHFTAAVDEADLPVYWLGALGSIAPGTGATIVSKIKQFLAELPGAEAGYTLKAYTVAEWGVNSTYAIPLDSPLLKFFRAQGFHVSDYSWKPPGTWASYYGGCLAGLEYRHRP